MTANEVFEESRKYIMNTYKRLPLFIVKGRGNRVYDGEGKEYLDFVSGLAVNNIGHCNPRVTVAFQKQAQRLVHTSNLFYTEPQVKLAKLLVENSFADKVFFCNSGAEANEAAIKLIRKYSSEKETGRYGIITALNSFHGRTMATLTATGQDKFHKGFEPLVPGFFYVPFNDIAAVEKAINDKTAAVMIEPIQGEGGVNIPDRDYLKRLREICDLNGILLALDEVQTGIGRTGKLFAYQHTGIEPDIMTLAKGLGGGLPIGAMLAKDHVASAFTPGTHASTFGGTPLVCSAAVEVMKILTEDEIILDTCRRMGSYLVDELNNLKLKYPDIIKDIRGKGLLIGMELNIAGEDVVRECLKKGVIINCTMERVLRFLPPLDVSQPDIDKVIETLTDVFNGIRI
ncbi:MAG: acetylornithine aminotransferase [Nitrospirae bacterium RBG_16_43_11]|nr:MAG: acetylornithine aminotransferase [Nitrospirae bacterium RBG_16_43_11]